MHIGQEVQIHSLSSYRIMDKGWWGREARRHKGGNRVLAVD